MGNKGKSFTDRRRTSNPKVGGSTPSRRIVVTPENSLEVSALADRSASDFGVLAGRMPEEIPVSRGAGRLKPSAVVAYAVVTDAPSYEVFKSKALAQATLDYVRGIAPDVKASIVELVTRSSKDCTRRRP